MSTGLIAGTGCQPLLLHTDLRWDMAPVIGNTVHAVWGIASVLRSLVARVLLHHLHGTSSVYTVTRVSLEMLTAHTAT